MDKIDNGGTCRYEQTESLEATSSKARSKETETDLPADPNDARTDTAKLDDVQLEGAEEGVGQAALSDNLSVGQATPQP
jgi:hypothetical protein